MVPPVADIPVRRAGGLVVRPQGAVAVVHRPRRDDWTFPKGRIEVGETPEQCARREVREETGFRCLSSAFAGHVMQPRRRGGPPKVVAYWLMRPIGGRFVPGDEVDELRWVEPDAAAGLLTYEHDRSFLLRALVGPDVAAGL